MPSIHKNNTINGFRNRKRLRQAMLHGDNIDAITLSRISNGHQAPYARTSMEIMHKMDIPAGTLFNPFLENQPLAVYKLRGKLLYTLDRAPYAPDCLKESLQLLDQMEKLSGFDSGINRQFTLSCRARLGILQKMDPHKILAYTREGIYITYPEYDPDTFEGDVLLYEEARLIHTQALAYANDGQPDKAIKILQRAYEGLSRLPQDDKHKIHHLAPVMLDLARLLTDAGKYGEALEICEKGIGDMTVTRTKGRYAPDFTYYKARALNYLGQKEGLRIMLVSAFHGYVIMQNITKAREVKAFAQSIGIDFDTYGVENLPIKIPDRDFDRGESIPCSNFGELMRGLRKNAGITLRELCKGLCNTSTFNSMEKSKSKYPIGGLYLLEGLMQRMGRDIDEYFYTLLDEDDFEDKYLRDRIYTLIAAKKCHEAEPLLTDLGARRKYGEKINLQFIKMNQAEIYGNKQGYDERYMQLLTEAWLVTKGKPNEGKIADIRITYYEIIILNDMAIYLCDNGESERGLKIFDGLIKNLDSNYVDETERMRTYLTVLYHYTMYLGRNEYRPKALKLARDGYELSIKHNDLWHASRFMINIAVNLFQLGQKEESIPHFALAYFGSVIMKMPLSQKAIFNYTKERLGIIFE
ncbi:MAG: tetratricopeptide repeat protein [Defluviitaleaceae bacterium]|nr:tetratricopeptide repeat protein [Defluviitaleaceae bacterium]